MNDSIDDQQFAVAVCAGIVLLTGLIALAFVKWVPLM